ncbi:hypothetical protein [Pedobacter alpinus]|uniref:DUF1574 domain-containing protein n=1 Tax=Pedobacter alpinus TaxID=1590643 RepID=A0ABW5TSX9_9SPHI
MKKFFLKSFLFTAILATAVFYFSSKFERKYHKETDYLAAIIDKENRLNSIDSNRLILVGGSNLAFGLNCELIEQKLPVKVANLGLHAGLSLKFMINEVSSLIKSGDIVILNLEYPLYLDGFEPDIDLIQFTQEIYPKSKEYYQFNPLELFEARYEKFKKYFEEQDFKTDSVFNRKMFNKYGDNIGHLNKPSLQKLIDRQPIGLLETNNSFSILKDFYELCEAENVKVYITYPSYPSSEFVGKNKDRILQLNTKIKENLPQIKLLNSPDRYVFTDDNFYDTIYHLNAKGREKRTLLFIEDLKPVIAKKQLFF